MGILWTLAFLSPGTSFVEDGFSMDQVGGKVGRRDGETGG